METLNSYSYKTHNHVHIYILVLDVNLSTSVGDASNKVHFCEAIYYQHHTV